jgi:hypothetical protein
MENILEEVKKDFEAGKRIRERELEKRGFHTLDEHDKQTFPILFSYSEILEILNKYSKGGVKNGGTTGKSISPTIGTTA